MRSISRTPVSVLQRARRGDTADLASLYAPLAFAMARRLGLAVDDAEDVMQQTMLDVLRMLPDFEYDPARGSFKGLLKKIVCNRATDLRRRRRTVGDSDALEALGAEDGALDAIFDREWRKTHLVAALEQVRSEVKPTTFQAFQLCVLEEQSPARVAETLGLSPNQVAQNKHRVLERLRDRLRELEHGID